MTVARPAAMMMTMTTLAAPQAGSTLGSALGAVVYNGKIDGGNWNWGLTISQCFGVQSLLVIATLLPLIPFM